MEVLRNGGNTQFRLLSLSPSFLLVVKKSSQDVHIFMSQISSARTPIEMNGTLDWDLKMCTSWEETFAHKEEGRRERAVKVWKNGSQANIFRSQISSARMSLEIDGTLNFDCYKLGSISWSKNSTQKELGFFISPSLSFNFIKWNWGMFFVHILGGPWAFYHYPFSSYQRPPSD